MKIMDLEIKKTVDAGLPGEEVTAGNLVVEASPPLVALILAGIGAGILVVGTCVAAVLSVVF